MNITEAIKLTSWYERLGIRQQSFEYMVKYFTENLYTGRNVIVETGTARRRNNWEGDGQSTLVWDWLVGLFPDVKVISIDADAEAIVTAQSQTQHVSYLCGDSIEELRKLCSYPSPVQWDDVGLLYLDSFDWDMRHKYLSAFHALCELMAVWEVLPKDCLIVVDDMLSAEFGKHAAIAEFMWDRQIPVHFIGHQVGWLKS